MDVVFRGSYYAYELALEQQEETVFVYSKSKETVPDDGRVGLSWTAESSILLAEGPHP
jgi:hypothetical protein